MSISQLSTQSPEGLPVKSAKTKSACKNSESVFSSMMIISRLVKAPNGSIKLASISSPGIKYSNFKASIKKSTTSKLSTKKIKKPYLPTSKPNLNRSNKESPKRKLKQNKKTSPKKNQRDL
jgi:hypothetical protein